MLQVRSECRASLWPHEQNGDTLLQWSTNDHDALAALATHATTRALPTAMVSR